MRRVYKWLSTDKYGIKYSKLEKVGLGLLMVILLACAVGMWVNFSLLPWGEIELADAVVLLLVLLNAATRQISKLRREG